MNNYRVVLKRKHVLLQNAIDYFNLVLLLVLFSLLMPDKGNAQDKSVRAVHTKTLQGLNTGKQADQPPIEALLNPYNVNWTTPGSSSLQSMPIGNGDIGLNVWVEQNGDINFYISKTDAWNGDVYGPKALLKLAGVHISLHPNPLKSGMAFLQSLKLYKGEIIIKEGSGSNRVQLRVWVDANHPVVRVAAESQKAISMKVVLNDWRLNGGGDTVIANQKNSIVWYHRNGAEVNDHVANLTFGAAIKGKNFVNRNDTTLQSGLGTSQLISIFPLAATTSSATQWKSKLDQQIFRVAKLDEKTTFLAHEKWWATFWQRSWMYVSGDSAAYDITRGYVLQRFISACAGRGAYPIKFNGSIFVVDNPELKQDKKPPIKVNADYRIWGGQYWFQNTRAMYWPMLMAGDFDEMMPLFKMYAAMLPDNEAQVKKYYHHGGAYFQETAPFWGGLRYMGPEVKEDWTGHYFTPILELSMMMLDYYQYTGDTEFAKKILIPVAAAGLQFFYQHFGRDSAGKLLLDPDNSIEMFWKVHDPAPDIAGLHAITTRMLALPDNITTPGQRNQWSALQRELPNLPMGIKDGNKVLLPYTGAQTAKPRNLENPELYAIYPFRLYGLGRPDLPLALNTFSARKFKDKGCWVQDPIQAAMLGLTGIAKADVLFNFTRKAPELKFPAFWANGHDYMPDQDNGGNAENGLQQMLMQVKGKEILLLPAWPKDWSADFKLNAPYNTTVQGVIKQGKLIKLIVHPAARKSDIIDMSTHMKPKISNSSAL